jgi:uncharacterized protein (TIGR03437 family)
MNRTAFRFCAFGFLIGAVIPHLAAQPAISTVTNAASGITSGLPNAGIAQGGIFVVYGTGLGPTAISVSSAPFQNTTLDGTSVAVTIGGTTVNALMYYTLATQVAALLPSDAPTGTGTVTVTYNSQTSASVPFTVVANNLGVFTVDSSGGGAGIVTYPDYSLVSPLKAANCGGPNTTCGAANSGDTLILWATGLGPVSGSDASGAGLGQNMPNIPLKLWLGGVQASVSYQGRSGCCIGEDQIVFTVPANVPTGCAVPLIVQIGDEISNSTVMPVSSGSRTCPLHNAALAPIGTAQIEQLVSTGAVTAGSLRLAHYSDGGGTWEDDAKFQFARSTVPANQAFFVSWLDSPPPGSCLVYSNLNGGFNDSPITGQTLLDAGSSFTVTGPQGSVNLPVNSGTQSAFNSTGAFLVPGSYTITGTGGANVGSFTANVTLPTPSILVSPLNNATVTRSSGLPVTWTGSSENLLIEVNSCSDGSCNNGASALCVVPNGATAFTVPPYILDALPAGTSAGLVLSSDSFTSFTATGLNAGILEAYINDSGFGYGWGSGGFVLQ